MNEQQHKKFEKWLEPFIINWGSNFASGPFIETSQGTLNLGSEEHENWLKEKKAEFLRKEPPLAGIVYVPWLIQTVPEGTIDEDRDAASKKWNDEHAVCPKCENPQIMQSLAGVIWHVDKPYEDNINTAFCGKCEWNGKVNELKPKHNEN